MQSEGSSEQTTVSYSSFCRLYFNVVFEKPTWRCWTPHPIPSLTVPYGILEAPHAKPQHHRTTRQHTAPPGNTRLQVKWRVKVLPHSLNKVAPKRIRWVPLTHPLPINQIRSNLLLRRHLSWNSMVQTFGTRHSRRKKSHWSQGEETTWFLQLHGA